MSAAPAAQTGRPGDDDDHRPIPLPTRARPRPRRVPRTAQWRLLHEVTTLLASELDLDQVLRRVADAAVRLVGADAGVIAVLSADRATITYPYLIGLPLDLRHVVIPAGSGVAGLTMTGRATIHMPDYPAAPQALPAFVEAGVQSLVSVPIFHRDTVLGSFAVFGLDRDAHFSRGDEEVLQALAGHAAIAMINARIYEQQRQILWDTTAALADAIEAKDPYTGFHSTALSHYALALGRALGLPPPDLDNVRFTCLLHDVGKIAVPDGVLRKPGPLTEDEWLVMRTHPEVGARIVEKVQLIRHIGPLVRHHHERWDGTGYPDGLAGEAIPLISRIVSIADAYEALTSDRVYRPRLSMEGALEILRQGADRIWDGRLVDLFARLARAGFTDPDSAGE